MISAQISNLPQISIHKSQNIIYSTQLHKKDKTHLISFIIKNTFMLIDQKSIKYSFDLKFAINKDIITFYQRNTQQSFYIVKEDYLKIREALKYSINQIGFHQQFKPIKKIGQGNFASVYWVKKISTGQDFAVKAFSKQSTLKQINGKECLIKQIQVMRALNNSHNMKLYQVFESDKSFYLVFELLNNGLLLDRIKVKRRFQQNEIKKILYYILQGLREMHSQGIMHRDLKPENILFRNEFECVIADYGLSQFVETQKYLYTRCGTPGYVAPEVINFTDLSIKYNCQCDMFSLGLIFYLLLFGKSLFVGKIYNDILNQNKKCNISLQGEKFQKLPKQAFDLLKKMLKINPSQRITSEQALKHPYFSQKIEEADLNKDIVEKIEQKIQQNLKNSSELSTNAQSPILNPLVNENKKTIKYFKQNTSKKLLLYPLKPPQLSRQQNSNKISNR